MKVAGKMVKWFFGIVGAIVVLGIILAVVGGGNEDQPSSEPKTEQKADKPVEKKEPVESVTKAAYDKIKQGDALTGKGGMSVEEVVAILGEPNDKMESSYDDGNGNEVKSEDYTWVGKDFQTISVSFTNGHVSHKLWMD